MSVQSGYLKKQNFVSLSAGRPSSGIRCIVVIPCKNEMYLPETLQSLEIAAAGLEDLVEIIIVINDHLGDSQEVILQNEKTLQFILTLKYKVKLIPLSLSQVPYKIAGVGYARKIGMDEAVHRFESIGRSDGIICSMDADTIVSASYFKSIIESFQLAQAACLVVEYHHRWEGLEEEHQQAIVLYELHLRYYVAALRQAGFRHAVQTLGSAFAVKASAYAAQGGMSTRKAGEDFYFIHKFTKLDQVASIKTTTVFPSSRRSDRVPFGTGKAIIDALDKPNEEKKSYALESFKDLKQFLDQLGDLYNHPDWMKLNWPTSITSFLQHIHFDSMLEEIRKNAKSPVSFQKRFFQNMDAFMMMKYVHFARDHFYKNESVVMVSNQLMRWMAPEHPYIEDPMQLLHLFRRLQF